MSNIDWKKIIEYYNSIKSLYIECEESDPELKTNLQPLNEFRAALDHIMRINAIENLQEYKDQDVDKQVEKLWSHLRRAYYDICDMLSINYRNKIIDSLKIYSSDEIMKVIPEYYSDIRPDIDRLSTKIGELRDKKNFNTKNEISNCDEYKEIIYKLKNYYETISSKSASLVEIHNETKKEKTKKIVTQYVIPIAGVAVAIIGIILGIIL